ncbi:MAG: xylulokinase [Gemmatimonadales bacterium]
MHLGLDIGTSSVKGVLIDSRQKIVHAATAPLSVSRPAPGWWEQAPEDWWKAANRVVAELARRKPKAVAAVAGIGLSGQQHGATLLDPGGQVLRPAILWNDARAFVECRELEDREPRTRAIAGNIPLAGFTAPKLIWVRKHEPEIFAKVAKVLLPKDYVRLRMTGDYASDLSDSAGTLWLDVGRRAWSDQLLAASDMRPDQMPSLHEGTEPTGRLTPAVAKRWGMPLRPVVAGGGGDNAASACGIGAVTPGSAFISIGTSGVLFVSNDRFTPNAARAVHTFCHAVPGTWHQMGVILSAAASLEWLAGILKVPAPKLAAGLGARPTGPSPTLFLPYLSGERTPVADAQVRAMFTGLGHETGPKQLTHAVLDGVAFAFRDCLEALEAAGTVVNRVTAVGGGSGSTFWLRIIATVLGVPIDLPAAGDFGAAFGAARLGLIAATGASFREVCTPPSTVRTIDPDPRVRESYEAQYRRYTQLYPALKEIHRS